MYSLCTLAIASCLLSLALTPLMRDWSIRLGLVDRPDSKRKLHAVVTPRTGGIPILAAYVGAYAVLALLPFKGSSMIAANIGSISRLLPAVALIFITGLLDDWLNLRPWQKLLGQLAASVWAYWAGVRILAIAGHPAAPWVGFVLTVAWLILCSNAFNLIDGVDGLATGVGVSATLTTLVAGVLHGDVMLGFATAPLAGCLIGFLRYNFNPASIFLGDSGSLLIGFLLGSYGVIWSQKSATMLGMAAPAVAIALPLLEVCLSIARRFLRNEPIFAGDRGHIHHRLLERGFTPRRVALLLYGACGLGAVCSLLQSVIQNYVSGLVILLFGGITCAGIQYLEYAEFEATRRFLWAGFRPTLSAHVKLQVLERSLLSATTVDECWRALDRTARSLGYSHMSARLRGIRFETTPGRTPNTAFWQMRLNLPDRDYVNITQQEGAPAHPVLVVPFIDVVRRVLPGRLELLAVPFDLTTTDAISRTVQTQAGPRNSSTSTVISSDCGAPSVKVATAS